MGKKVKRAPAGSRAIITRIVQFAENPDITYTEAARLLGISRRQLYSHRMTIKKGLPVKTVMARPSTVEKYERRLGRAAAQVLAEHETAISRDKKPRRKPKVTAKLTEALSGRTFHYQQLSAWTRQRVEERKKRPPPPSMPPRFAVPSAPPPLEEPISYARLYARLPEKEPEEYTRADMLAGLTRKWVEGDVRFMKQGEIWSEGREPYERRRTNLTAFDRQDVINYFGGRGDAMNVLVVIEVYSELSGQYIYEIWVDYVP